MKNQVGGLIVPHPMVMMQGNGVALSCAKDGSISADSLHGLFAGDTRVLSTYRIAISGYSWVLLGRSFENCSNSTWTYQNPAIRTPSGNISAGSILFTLRRRLHGALHDEFEIASFSPEPIIVRLTLQIGGDFSDIFEVRDGTTWPRLNIHRILLPNGFALSYKSDHFDRSVEVQFNSKENRPIFGSSLVVFDIKLDRGKKWNAQVDIIPDLEKVQSLVQPLSITASGLLPLNLAAAPILQLPFDRALRDLDDLTVQKPGHHPYLAAGVPWFFTLFGRDSLVAGMMSSIVGTSRLNGALSELARLQAVRVDNWRDAEPGKLAHEIRIGELTETGSVPFSPYYGAHDVPALYCIALWSSWRWSGNKEVMEKYLPTALAALEWCRLLGDRDGDGLLEYATRSEKGYFNQSWKDSGEAIVHQDGSLPRLPIATVELQGYYYAALLAMAEMVSVQGDLAEARRLMERASVLRSLVEERFWMESAGFYAMGLDGDKRQIQSISSNPGHLLWCGLPSVERARKISDRFLNEDMFSGWGLRTLSSAHVAYNPLAYQLGSVWPHDTLLVTAGLQRYGAFESSSRLIKSILEAALHFEQQRLPELFCGISRSEGLPVPYERANIPQAWAAASPPLVVQLFLGLVPDAPRNRCFLSPHLPEWLPEMRVENIPIGHSSLSVNLKSKDGHTVVDHLESGDLEVILGSEVAPIWGRPI